MRVSGASSRPRARAIRLRPQQAQARAAGPDLLYCSARGWVAVLGIGGLTSHSSRCRFAARLNSGVRRYMMRISVLWILVTSLIAASAIGCSTTTMRQTPLGHSCFREFSQVGDPRTYVCLFEMSAPSKFYVKDQQERIVREFLTELPDKCRVTGKWEMIRDSTYRLYHTTSYVVHRIEC